MTDDYYLLIRVLESEVETQWNDDYIQSTNWKIDLANESATKMAWTTHLETKTLPFDTSSAELVRDELVEALRDPPLPEIDLRRENITDGTKSSFQHFLAGYIFKEEIEGDASPVSRARSLTFNFVEPSEEIFRSLLESKGKLFAEIVSEQDKLNIKCLRWYQVNRDIGNKLPVFTPQSSVTSNESDDVSMAPLLRLNGHGLYISFNDEEEPFLFKLFNCIYETLLNHVGVIKKILQAILNEEAFLHEYCKYWSAYTASISKIETSFASFNELINELYEQLFPEYPFNPKFSMMRLMVITWRRYVKDPLRTRLTTGLTSLYVQYFDNVFLEASENSLGG